jgi:phage-related protein
MSFSARDFVYKGIPSENFGISIGDLASTTPGSGEIFTPGSSDLTLVTEHLFRRPSVLYYGSEQSTPLSFTLSAYSTYGEITAHDYSLISKWLFGNMDYEKLCICQPDLADVYFNALMTTPQTIRTGNQIIGFTANISCDSPWGCSSPDVFDYSFDAGSFMGYGSYSLYNRSANNFYTYPTLEISSNLFGGSVTITNASDSNRQFVLNLLPNENLIVDCDNQIITSDTSTYPLANFNKNWLRFVPGFNDITISGNVQGVFISSPVAVKISG